MVTPSQRRGADTNNQPGLFAACWPLAAVAALTLLAFIPALRAGWIWDDDSYVTANPTLRSAAGLWRIWTDHRATPQYYPLVFTTFWLEYRLWGVWPGGYHAVNVLCHAGTAGFLFLLLRRLSVRGAALAALLFAVHPVMVESVAWVTERKNVLSGLLYFASAWCYVRSGYAPAEQTDHTRRDNRFYAAALALFTGALLSKTVTCSLPAAVLLVIYWKRGRIGVRDVVPLLPFFALALPLALHTSWLEKHHVGAAGPAWVYGSTMTEDFLARCVIAGRAVWFYAGKLVWPTDLAFIYPRFAIDIRQPWQWAFPAGLLLVIAGLFVLRRRLGRGPLVAVLFFVGTLFPALGFFAVLPHRYSFVADHFQYLAAAGLLTLGAAGFTRLIQRLPRVRVGLSAALLAIFIALTFRQALIYANSETLWRDTIAKNPDSWMVNSNYANALLNRGRAEEATPHFEHALALNPIVRDTHLDIGLLRVRQNRIDDAEAAFREAVRLDPKFPSGYEYLGKLHRLYKGDFAQAERFYARTLELNASSAEAYFGLAVIRERKGRPAEAEASYRSALALDPTRAEAHFNLANLLLARKDYAQAAAGFAAAVALDPRHAEAWTNLGAAQLYARRPNDAATSFERALQINPALAPAQRGRAEAVRQLRGGR